MKYKVRVYDVGLSGFITQADNYNDYTFKDPEPLEIFAARLAKQGFRDGDKWIMPGAIVWIKEIK